MRTDLTFITNEKVFIKNTDFFDVLFGSFLQVCLVDNLEFNVELKNRADYEFAKKSRCSIENTD